MNNKHSVSSLLLSSLSLAACAPVATPAAPEPEPAPARAQTGVLAETVASPKEPAAVADPAPRRLSPKVVAHSGTFLGTLDTAVTSFGAAASGDMLYLLGGYSGVPHAYSKEGQSAEVLAIDRSGAVKQIATMPEALQGVPAVLFRDRLCAFGGSHASNASGAPTVMTSVSSARCLSLGDGTWSEFPPLPEGRSSHGAALVGSTVYVAGGWTLTGKPESGVFASELLALDLARPERGWTKIPAPFARRAVGVAALGTRLFVVGGMTSEQKISASVDVYDTTTKKWSKGPDFPRDAFGIAVVAQNGKLYASARDGVLRSLGGGDRAWRDVRPLAYGRFFHQLLPFEGDLVALGGIGGMHTRGRNRVIERVSLDGSPSLGTLTVEFPGVAKNREGILLREEELLLFGGNDSLEQHDFARTNFENEAWTIDLSTLEFRETSPYPFRRQSMQLLSLGDRALSLGGFGHEPLPDPKSEAISHGEVVAFDWEKGLWKSVSSLPRGRTQFGVVARGDDAWIFGGLNYDPSRKTNTFDHDRSIWKASLREGAPSFVETNLELPEPRRAFAGALFDGKYVMVGGMKDNFELVDGCLEFDFATEKFADFPCPAPRLSGDLVPAGGKLFLVGGSVKTKDGIEESRAVEVFDPKTRKWKSVGFELPFSTKHLRALPYRDQVLLVTLHSEKPALTIGLLSP